MDDSSCVMKLIEITPFDNIRNCSESADVKLSPCHIKVCTQDILHLLSNFNILLPHGNARTIPFAFLCFFVTPSTKSIKFGSRFVVERFFRVG